MDREYYSSSPTISQTKSVNVGYVSESQNRTRFFNKIEKLPQGNLRISFLALLTIPLIATSNSETVSNHQQVMDFKASRV